MNNIHISLESVFGNVIKIMKQFDQEKMEYFIERLRAVVKKAEHMGWGYHDAISGILYEAYNLNKE